MGILGKGMGYDRVVWGTDAVWTGSPQWQILGQPIANRLAWRTNGLGAHPGVRYGHCGPIAAGLFSG
jgi:uncharacterized protein